MKAAVEELSLDVLFLDVTLNTWNLHNCLVENLTPTEGMRRLTAEIASLKPGLAIGGEGRNEITALNSCWDRYTCSRAGRRACRGWKRLFPAR